MGNLTSLGRVLGLWGLALGLAFISVKGQAATDVTCLEGGCLVEGWQIVERSGGLKRSQVTCFAQDCEGEGWFHHNDQGLTDHFTRCLGRGCFLDGWEILSPSSGQPVGEVWCRQGQRSATQSEDEESADCLRFGWEVFNRFGRLSHRVSCVGEDCRGRGWDVEIVGYGFQTVRCKQGGCFQQGWTLRP